MHRPRFCLIIALAIAPLLAPAVSAEERVAANPAELADVVKAARPGDAIVMADGQWKDADILFEGHGTADRPITLRAKTPGQVALCGQSRLRIFGSYLVADGLCFKDGYRERGDVVEFRGGPGKLSDHCRLTQCAITSFNPPDRKKDYKWVSLYGAHNRVDHCFFKGMDHTGTLLVVWLSDQVNEHLIDHNYFGERPRLGWNGGEIIRVGTSEWSMHTSRTIVEDNYFERCNGEIEIISSKSCENVYRYNTFVECEGTLTLRHGNRCTVESNYFLGHHKKNTGGVRVIGEDHKVFNNYFADLGGTNARAALCLMNGIPNSPLSGYFQVRNAVVAFNAFVGCEENIVIGQPGRDATIPPENPVVANNIVVGSKAPLVRFATALTHLTWAGNIMFGAEVGVPAAQGIKIVDPKLALASDRLMRPNAESPVVGAAEGEYPFVKDDGDGQPRGARKDVGCDQVSSAPVLRRPLTPADVGPEWMRAAK